MATVTKTLRMVFKSQAGNNITITLDNPKEDLTAAEVEAAMDLVIARNIFESSGGDLVSKYDIKVVDTTVNDMFDPPQA